MKISKSEIAKLSEKVLSGSATEEEFRVLNEWFHSYTDEEVMISEDIDKENFKTKVLSVVSNQETSSSQIRPTRRWLKYAAVITLFAIAGVVGWWILQSQRIQESGNPIFSSIQKTADPGQKMTFQLPDGSIVKLNSGSSIDYFENEKNQRLVILSGEAFFDVARDEKRPFIIKTSQNICVEVLGTSFNVKSYTNDHAVEVVVKTGLVRVRGKDIEASLDLLPSSKLVVNGPQYHIDELDEMGMEMNIGWTDKKLILHDEELSQITKKLSRWYGVNIELSENFDHEDIKVEGIFNNASLREVLETLSHNYNFKYEINDKDVMIK